MSIYLVHISIYEGIHTYNMSSVQLISCVELFATPWNTAHQASLSNTYSQSLRKLMSIELVMPSNHLTLCHPLLLLSSIFPSIRIFSNESVLHIRWPSVGTSASSSVLPMNIQDSFPIGLPGLISLQSKGSKALTLWCLAFFMVQLSHPYTTTGKTIASTIQTFVDKVKSLLFYYAV